MVIYSHKIDNTISNEPICQYAESYCEYDGDVEVVCGKCTHGKLFCNKCSEYEPRKGSMIMAIKKRLIDAMGMDEYIRREEAIDAVLDAYFNTPKINLIGKLFYNAILKLQPADVAPVRHAKVIDKISDDHETIKPWDYRYYCSACKIPMRDSWNKYCPTAAQRWMANDAGRN